jgi:hypothetical protein
MSIVPKDWTLMMGQHRAAMVAWDQMRDPGATQTMRDEALSGQQVLGRITMLLARKDRA